MEKSHQYLLRSHQTGWKALTCTVKMSIQISTFFVHFLGGNLPSSGKICAVSSNNRPLPGFPHHVCHSEKYGQGFGSLVFALFPPLFFFLIVFFFSSAWLRELPSRLWNLISQSPVQLLYVTRRYDTLNNSLFVLYFDYWRFMDEYWKQLKVNRTEVNTYQTKWSFYPPRA